MSQTKIVESVNMRYQDMFSNWLYDVKNIFEKEYCYGSSPTFKDLPPALTSTPTYILANSPPPPTLCFGKNYETMKS